METIDIWDSISGKGWIKTHANLLKVSTAERGGEICMLTYNAGCSGVPQDSLQRERVGGEK